MNFKRAFAAMKAFLLLMTLLILPTYSHASLSASQSCIKIISSQTATFTKNIKPFCEKHGEDEEIVESMNIAIRNTSIYFTEAFEALNLHGRSIFICAVESFIQNGIFFSSALKKCRY